MFFTFGGTMFKSVFASALLVALINPLTASAQTAGAHEFVQTVSRPVDGRGLSRWSSASKLCVGVANLEEAAAQSIADRVSDIAADLGVSIADPGCTPNVLVIASANGAEAADRFVSASSRENITPDRLGSHHGQRALQSFTSTEAPVRWWQTSAVYTDTGHMIGNDQDANLAGRQWGSRLNSDWQDYLSRTVVIIEPAKLAHLNTVQLADYVAMVSLSQIKPDADTSSYDTILNVVQNADAASNLTALDWAYLRNLYALDRRAKHSRAAQSELAAQMVNSSTR